MQPKNITEKRLITFFLWHNEAITEKIARAVLQNNLKHLQIKTKNQLPPFNDLNDLIPHAHNTLKEYQKINAQPIALDQPQYPHKIRQLKTPPPFVIVQGNIHKLNAPQIAIVGSRKPTPFTKHITQQIVERLIQQNYIITSGAAIGVDSIAHRTAIKHNADTIIVSPTGLNNPYPTSNQDLYNYAKTNTAIIAIQPINTPPIPQRFPSRNAIIAALSDAIIITQAGLESGALYTAKAALQLQKNIWIPSAPAFDENYYGCFNLLKDNIANLITFPSQLDQLTLSPKHTPYQSSLLEYTPTNKTQQTHATKNDLNNTQTKLNHNKDRTPEENTILETLKLKPQTLEELLHTKLSIPDLHNAIINLEINGLIKKLPNATYSLNS